MLLYTAVTSCNQLYLAVTRYKSFWSSNTQLFLLLAAMRELLETGWDWDYVMNISGHL